MFEIIFISKEKDAYQEPPPDEETLDEDDKVLEYNITLSALFIVLYIKFEKLKH